MLALIKFIVLNSLIALSSYLPARRYFGRCGIVSFWLSLATLFFAQAVFITMFLGSVGRLYFGNIISLGVILLAVSFYAAKYKSWPGAPGLAYPKVKPNKVQIFFLAVILGFAIVKSLINLANPPFGWDDLNYHFTFPVEWLKHGNLINPIVVNDYMAPSYYPFNGSLIFFWLMLPFRSVYLADLGQLPFFVICFLSVFGISRQLGVNRQLSFLAAVIFTITPNYFKQLEVAYVDVMVAAFFLAAVNFLLIFFRKPDTKSIILAAINMGLLIGTKNIAVFHLLILFVFFMYALWEHRLKIGYRRGVSLIIVVFLLTIIFGGFSYIRNFILTGNPLYPLDLKVGGFSIFRGVMSAGYPAGELNFSFIELLFHEGLGAGFILFVIPGLFILGTQILKDKIQDKAVIGLVILIPYLYLVYRYIVSLPNLRYLYPWIAVCYIVVFLAVAKTNIPLKIVYPLAVISIFASIPEIATHTELIFSLLISLLLFIILNYRAKVMAHLPDRRYIVISALVIFLSFLYFSYKDYARNEYARYRSSREYSGFWPDAIEGWIWLNNKTSGDNIAYVGRPAPFPLYGSGFKNNVYYVSVNKTEPARLHYYPQSYYRWGKDHADLHKNLEAPGNYRGDADYSLWRQNLLHKNTGYLFIYSLHQIKGIDFPFEDEWAKGHPEAFNLAFKNDTIHIYKLK